MCVKQRLMRKKVKNNIRGSNEMKMKTQVVNRTKCIKRRYSFILAQV